MTSTLRNRPRIEVRDEQKRATGRLSRAIRRPDIVSLAVLLAAALAFHSYNRGHLSIGVWDESIHAVVAEHLSQHLQHPTLYEVSALAPPVSYNWSLIQTWLHVPPFGLWMAALSMRVLGETPFAMRLPGLLYVLLGMVVTFLLGRRLFNSWVGLAGAAFAGFAPYAMMISLGYMFGDMTDTPLMLFTPLAVLLLVKGYQTSQYRWVVLAGVCQGVCYLTKGAIGLAPTGVALALCLCDWAFAHEDGWHPLRLRGLATFLAASVVTAAPWSIYTSHAFPATAALEATLWHLNLIQNVEEWGGPIDTHLTSYLYALYGPALALLLLTSVLTVAAVALLRRSRADVVIVVWIAALYLPLTFAVTKTPNMTYAAIPAVGLAVGRFVVLGIATRSRWARAGFIGVLAGAAVMALLIITHVVSNFGFSYATVLPNRYHVVGFKHRLLPYVWDAGLSLAAAAIYLGASTWLASHTGGRALLRLRAVGGRKVAILSLGLLLVILGAYWVRYDFQVIGRPTIDTRPQIELGHYLETHTPANATVLLIASPSLPAGYNTPLQVMFWAHRDVYSTDELPGNTICTFAAAAARASSPFYVVMDTPDTGNVIGTVDDWTIIQPVCS